MSHEFLQECDIDAALREIGFREVSDCLEWKWYGLSIFIGFWFGSMRKVHVRCFTEREITDYEKYLPVTGIKGWYIAEIYKVWRDEFPTEPVPASLKPGLEYIEYQKVLLSLIPHKPSICVDRAWMRVMITQLRKVVEEIVPDHRESFPMQMRFDQGQMVLDTPEQRLSVPASGAWLGVVTFDLRDFLRATRRFDRDPVVLSYADDRLTIGNRLIRATWNDAESITDQPER